MKPYKTLALLVVFVVVGGLAYYSKVRQSEREKAEAAEKQVFALNFDRLLELKVIGENGAFTVTRTEGLKSDDGGAASQAGGYQITEPVKDAASKFAVDSILDTLKGLEAKKVIKNVDNVSPFGLDRLTGRVIFKIGDTQHELVIGDETPDHDGRYVRKVGSNDVYIVDNTVNSITTKKVADIRERNVLKFDREKVQRITLKNDEGTFVIDQSGPEQFEIKEPFEMAGGTSEVKKVIATINNTRVKEFVSENAETLAPYGLDHPSIRVSVTLKDARKVEAIFAKVPGEKSADDRYYLKRVDRAPVYEINAYVYNDLSVGIEGLIAKKFVEFSNADVAEVEVGAAVVDRMTFKKTDNQWTVLPPWRFEVAKNAMSKLFTTARNLKVEKLIAPKIDDPSRYGFESPTLTFVAHLKDNLRSGFVIGKKTPDDGHYYARKMGSPYLFTVQADVVEKIPRDKAAFRETRLVRFKRSDIQRIELTSPEKAVTYQRKGEARWTMVSGDERSDNPPKVQSLITDITTLRADDFVDEPLQDAEYHFDNPSLKLDIHGEDETVDLVFGKADGDNVFVKNVRRNEVVLVKRNVFDKLVNKL